MSFIADTIHRMSPSQLRALILLAKSKNCIISSTASEKQIGKHGKALGGVFSSLVRHNFNGQKIVIPWGKSEDGRGLRWKLNEALITKEELIKEITELLEYG